MLQHAQIDNQGLKLDCPAYLANMAPPDSQLLKQKLQMGWYILVPFSLAL